MNVRKTLFAQVRVAQAETGHFATFAPPAVRGDDAADL